MSVFADIQVPQISQDELFAFHASHFADVSVAEFGVSFIGLQVPPAPAQTDKAEAVQVVDEEYYEEYQYDEYEEEQEEYGNYDEPFDPSVADLVPDFDFAVAVEAKPATASKSEHIINNETNEQKNNEDNDKHDHKDDAEDAEDGNIPQGNGSKPKKKKRRKKKNGAGNTAGGSKDTTYQKTDRQAKPQKPDLRKRTWDVVDKGLGSLDYDDSATDPGCMPAPLQRRRIQYED